jgi:hypothetical protein
MIKCKVCGCDLGDKELPFFVGGDAYCPQDFVHASEHSAAYGHFQAVKCARCACISVDCGLSMCGQCGFRVMRSLPAKHVQHQD